MQKFKRLQRKSDVVQVEQNTLANPSPKTRRNIAIIFTLMAVLIMVVPVFAATPAIITNIYNWILDLIKYVRYISIPAAGFFLVWNGIKYMATDDPSEVRRIKKNILKVLVALIVIWSIGPIISFVGDIVGGKGLSLTINDITS